MYKINYTISVHDRLTNEFYEIGDEKALVYYIGERFRPKPIYSEYWWLIEPKDILERHENILFTHLSNNERRFAFYDNYWNGIQADFYKEKAFRYYLDVVKKRPFRFKFRVIKKRIKPNLPKPKFRKDPVPYTHKYYSGGPSSKPRKIKQLHAMYLNPEYKGFNRGSRSDLPEGWWDDWHRGRYKSWKHQSKRRHQWKQKKGAIDM